MSKPTDVPPERPASLDGLDALVGTWEMEAVFEAGLFGPDSPEVRERGGRTTFEWLEGRFFLLQRFTVDNPMAPSGIAVIGVSEDEPDEFEQHYYDSRGVARVYRMRIEGDERRVWRAAPGFHQRYTGRISADGSRIDGAWESSPDGLEWTHDFALNYVRAVAE